MKPKKKIYCVGFYHSDLDDYPMYDSKIFKKLDDAIKYCINIIEKKYKKFGIRLNQGAPYSKIEKFPEDWKDNLINEDEIEFGYWDIEDDLNYFERDTIIIVKEIN